ncbi:MAG TPA: hypothetical protein DCL44_03340 [Elusimicrobia bacterium]|nr:hypothetical protein [Elusimicrobiota bacterium]
MKTVTKVVLGLLAAMALSWAPAVYAASDNGTEFGIEDDLTVIGHEGNWADADVELKGFSIFGSSLGITNKISGAAGNVFVGGAVQVSSGLFVAGGSTMTGGMYVTGVSSFTGEVRMNYNQNIYFSSPSYMWLDGGADGQVLKRNTNGALMWGNDLSGASAITGNHDRIQKIDQTGSGMGDSVFIQSGNGDTAGVTMLGSSMTVYGGLYMGSGSSITLSGAGSHITLPNLPLIGTDAANKTYVDSAIVGSTGPWMRDNALAVVKLSSITDRVGIGIAAPSAKLEISSAGADTSDMLLAVSTGAATDQEVFTVDASGNTIGKGNSQIAGNLQVAGNSTVSGNSQDGAALTNYHGVNTAGTSGTALTVAGTAVTGEYVAKFYSGAPAANTLAAWIRKK